MHYATAPDHLTLIVTLQNLGISCHFEDEINKLLHISFLMKHEEDDLFLASLPFSLLRQAGYNVPQG